MQKNHEKITNMYHSSTSVGGEVVVIALAMILIFPACSTANVQNQESITTLKNQGKSIVWDVTMNFINPTGQNDYAVFGEAPDAHDGPPADSYDVAKPPAPMPPYIRTYLKDNLPAPYTNLWRDYRHYPDSAKVWNLSVKWEPEDGESPTTITMSWSTADVDESEYTSVNLCTNAGVVLQNMLVNNTYTFSCPAYVLQNFKIICSTSGNHPPVANPDSYSTNEDTTLTIAAPGVLANDTDPDGDPLTAVKVSDPSHGAVTLNSNGGFTYIPSQHYSGSDSFTYKAYDGTTYSNVATVSLTINPAHYILTITYQGSGTVTKNPDQPWYTYGQVITLTANPSTGWMFNHWAGNLTGNQNPTTITMNGNKSVIANFTAKHYTLTITIQGSGTVTKNPDQPWYTYGQVITLTANPSTGWMFNHWAGNLTGNQNPTTITINGNKSVIANFTFMNHPPLTPGKPSGEAKGKVGVKYTYTAVTTDADSDQLYYQFNWGDGTTSEWIGPYNSGVVANASHTWTKKGSYGIKVKAKDIYGAESNWSEPMPITMPVSHNYVMHEFGVLFHLIIRFLRGEFAGMTLIQLLRTEGWLK